MTRINRFEYYKFFNEHQWKVLRRLFCVGILNKQGKKSEIIEVLK